MKTTRKPFRFSLKLACLAVFISFCFNCRALDYNVTFTASGASSSVDSVIVQNLTKKIQKTVPTGNVLNLTDVISATNTVNDHSTVISITPNPIRTSSAMSFDAPCHGVVKLTIYTPDGKTVTSKTMDICEGKNTFTLTLPAGLFHVHVAGNGYSWHTTAVSQTSEKCKPQIEFAGFAGSAQRAKAVSVDKTTMLYSAGDQLLYKGKSGNYTTIVTDVPAASKTTNFEFVECKDADNNYYAVVKIGTQTWMAENLKTTKYRNDYLIGTTSVKVVPNNATSCYQWPYLDIESNAKTFGRLYTWWAITNTDNLAPAGWHVATDDEWTALQNYLTLNGYNYDNTTSGNKIAKSLAANSDWQVSGYTGVPGNNLTKNNRSGFSALPGGNRNDGGGYQYLFSNGTWWTTTQLAATNAYRRNIDYSNAIIGRDTSNKTYGFSVRCVKD